MVSALRSVMTCFRQVFFTANLSLHFFKSITSNPQFSNLRTILKFPFDFCVYFMSCRVEL